MRADAAEYELVSPGSLTAVLELLAAEPGAWMPIAGGTELMVQFGAGRLKPRRLVNIFGLPELTQISLAEDSIRIGAGVTYTAVRNHPEIAAWPLLARSASWTGSIANQNRGTLGGNLVNGSPAADSPPALLVYEAQVELVSVRGVRTIAYADFHTGYKQTQLAPDELVLAIRVPRPAAGLCQYLRKVGPRNAMAISKVALGAVARVDGGLIRDSRVALASVSHAPFRCHKTEAVLSGAPVSADTIAQARAALIAEIAPLDDIRSTARYRAHVAANLLEEFLTQLGAPCSSQPHRDHGNTSLEVWNRLPTEEAEAQLLACCGSHAWASGLAAQRPFASAESLMQAGKAFWFSLPESDWLEAFAAHPRIGEKKAATTQYLASSESEQAEAQRTLDHVAEALLVNNRAYEEKFGFRYIVFASGRTAPELLAVLEARLDHTRDEELHEAARQQQSITNLRLRKWLKSHE